MDSSPLHPASGIALVVLAGASATCLAQMLPYTRFSMTAARIRMNTPLRFCPQLGSASADVITPVLLAKRAWHVYICAYMRMRALSRGRALLALRFADGYFIDAISRWVACSNINSQYVR
jgi:hypothetical protein